MKSLTFSLASICCCKSVLGTALTSACFFKPNVGGWSCLPADGGRGSSPLPTGPPLGMSSTSESFHGDGATPPITPGLLGALVS